jgi:hypothetical protein
MVRRWKYRAMIPTGILCGDSVAPVANFTNPAAGNVSGTITLSVNASDNDQIAGVQFQIDGANIGAPDTVAPYSISYDTRSVLNGAHTFTAIISDRAGNKTTLNQVVTMVNSPVVTVSIPAQGSTVSGVINITANVTSYDSSVNVQFQIDGGNYGGAQGGGGAHAIGLDTMAVSNAAHSFSAVASDAHGNSGAATNTATVRNVPPGMPPQPGPTGTIGDWVTNPDDPNAWDEGGGWYGSFGALAPFAVWTGKGFTLQVRSYMNYHADSKTAVCRITLNDGGGSYWATGAIYGGGYDGDYQNYSGWINVPNFGWNQIRGRLDVTREIGGDYYVTYHYTQVEFNWAG